MSTELVPKTIINNVGIFVNNPASMYLLTVSRTYYRNFHIKFKHTKILEEHSSNAIISISKLHDIIITLSFRIQKFELYRRPYSDANSDRPKKNYYCQYSNGQCEWMPLAKVILCG